MKLNPYLEQILLTLLLMVPILIIALGLALLGEILCDRCD